MSGVDQEQQLAASDERFIELRQLLRATQDMVVKAQDALAQYLPAGIATSRAGFLHSLEEVVGDRPAHGWKDEWVPLRMESLRIQRPQQFGETPEAELQEYVRANEMLEQHIDKWRKPSVDGLVARGWPEDKAAVYAVLSGAVRPAISRSLIDQSPRFAACTYALCDVMHYMYKEAAAKPPPLYRHLLGPLGLAKDDEAWQWLEHPDSTGFCGLTCRSIALGDCSPDNFDERGYLRPYRQDGKLTFEACDSPVVCFEPAAKSETVDFGEHSAVMTYTETTGAFPPNTLFRLASVKEPGEWVAPGGSRPQQRLLCVTATYLPPLPDPADAEASGGDSSQKGRKKKQVGGAGGKMVGLPNLLKYGTRDDFVAGLDDLLARPLLTIEQEFDRDMSWNDWKGKRYKLRDEWKYVNGAASTQHGCTPGTRDDGENDGMALLDFMERANDFIRQRRKDFTARGRSFLLLPETHAYLAADETRALRLYSGPAYQPINNFLRQIFSLAPDCRHLLARHTGFTFCATVRHITTAIRKLSAVATEEEASKPTYRGVRGMLPDEFWHPDETGIVCAVDMAFMSTSHQRRTPIQYMDHESNNVLWKLDCRPESDAGFHKGANIASLSQFAAEDEVLFPPCTLLKVKPLPEPGTEPAADPLSLASATISVTFAAKLQARRAATERRRDLLAEATVGPVAWDRTTGRATSSKSMAAHGLDVVEEREATAKGVVHFLAIGIIPTFH